MTLLEWRSNKRNLSGSYELSEYSSIDFGIQMTEVNNRFTGRNVQLDNWGGFTQPGELSDSQPFFYERVNSINWMVVTIHGYKPNSFTADIADVIAVAEASYCSQRRVCSVGDCGTGYCASTDWDIDKRTTEETTSAYFQFNDATEYNGMPINVQFGVRWEQTDVTSAALAPTYDEVFWLGGNEFTMVKAVDEDGNAIQVFDDYAGDYDHILPSFDFDIEVMDNLVLRASYSKTLTPPKLYRYSGRNYRR